MGISNDTKIIFKNGSTIKTIETNNKNVRSSDKTFPFLLGMCLPRCNGKHDVIHNLINETIKGEVDMATSYTTTDTSISKAIKALKDTSLAISQTISATEPKTVKILDLWKQKQLECLSDKYREVEDNLHQEDPLYKSLYDLALQMATEIAKTDSSVIEKQYKTFDAVATVILGSIGENFSLHTKDTMDKLDTGLKEYVAIKEKLNSDFHEIKVMLSACDTYEQEMEVLKNYGVVDKNGKLNMPTV